MHNKKIKILGIAPYQSLKASMAALSASYKNIELVTYVGNLEAGAELARQAMNDDFDIIISRGGTASMIRTFSPLPVIEISLSVYDILRTIRLTAGSAESCAVIGFPSITIPARQLCDLLHYNMKIITIERKEEALSAFAQIRESGCPFVLCDTIAETLAQQSGLKPLLITSGPESIKSAFDQALQICSFSSALIRKCSILEDALDCQPANTIILKADGSVFFSNYDAENISAIMEYLKELIQDPKNFSCTKAFHLIDNTLYSLTIQRTTYDETEVFLFNIEPNPVPAGSSKYGLRFTSYSDMVSLYTNSFYVLTSSAKRLKEQITQLSATTMPVMILGEPGTGKNQIAARLYLDGPLRKNPYIIIDCPLINEKNWNFLTKHYNSPFFDKDNTIFIDDIQALSDVKQQQLLSLFLDTNVHKRNRVIFSRSLTTGEQPTKAMDHFVNYLPCTTVFLPPLRELTNDIESSANLYLNNLNVELSKQIIGFEPDALELLCHYNWPDNFMQLKRVLADLVVLTTTQTIQAETVATILEREKRQYIPQTFDSFNYDRPLDQMVQDIVKVVLNRCSGNQTRAARQLGIGRTTLWRYLNTEND